MGITSADIPRLARDAGVIYAKWGALIHKYHAGCPESLIAVRMQVESGGKMNAPGDVRQGEVGILQITASTETRFGVPPQTRYTPDGNAFLGSLRYNVDTAITLKRYPNLNAGGAFDAYLFGGMLVSAIGVGAAYYLYNRAPRGLTFGQFADWVAAHKSELPTSGPWGGQSRDTIVYRVRAIWVIGEAAKQSGLDNTAGAPTVPPLPPGVRGVTIPREARDVMQGAQGMPHAGAVSELPWPLSLLKRIG